MRDSFNIYDKRLSKYLRAIPTSNKSYYRDKIEIELFKERIIDSRGEVRGIKVFKGGNKLGTNATLIMLIEIEDCFILADYSPVLAGDDLEIIEDFGKENIEALIEGLKEYSLSL